MRRFTQLYMEIERTMRTSEKVAAIESYFRKVPPEDAAWALYFLMGSKISRAVPTSVLRVWVSEEAGIPLWLVEECYSVVGDLAEALSLLLGQQGNGTDVSLHELVEERLLPLRSEPDAVRRDVIVTTWRELSAEQRLVWNKLMLGEYRIGVAKTLVIRALANVAEVPPEEMAHRLMGNWSPTAADYLRLLLPDAQSIDISRPYPFYLAYPLEMEPGQLGPVEEWQIEWKWDGIRAQLIRRAGQVLIWSRGEDLATDRFPEIARAAMHLPDGIVLDGEVLGWSSNCPLPFGRLQRRIGRKKVGKQILQEVPVVFMAYDLMEYHGEDVRELSLGERRERLEQILLQADDPTLLLSPVVESQSWSQLAALRETSRERCVEGFMLKRRNSKYGVGRTRGDWWKWKIDPYTIDAVLIYAQHGHGRRATLYTDYTFGVWQEGNLVPIAKAYSGLTDEEIRQVDAFIRRNTLEKFGPVRIVKPELVFELAFEGLQESSRHKAGIAVRFPRMSRWRKDKSPAEADDLETLRQMLHQHTATGKTR
jgi:DNA ligase-1